jgi:hypothetical protein
MKKIKDILPRGACKSISRIAGVSYSSVQNFINDREVGIEVQQKIIPAIEEYFEILEKTKKSKQNLLSYGL